MIRLVDADAEREAFMEVVYEELADDPDNLRANRIIDCFDSMATVEAAPVVHGEWKFVGVSDNKNVFQCTNCKSVITATGRYCKECGARMDGKATRKESED